MREELKAYKARFNVPPVIGYLPALYPDSEGAENNLRQAYESGLRFIETGFPAINPNLDGEVIRKALLELNEKNISLKEFIIESGRNIKNTGLLGVAMLYEETLESYGLEKFAADAALCGFDSILVPNISSENRARLYSETLKNGIEIVNFIAIGHSENEIEHIASETTGFLYLQSTDGATGGQFIVGKDSIVKMKMVKKIAEAFDLPVALGFGINSPDDADKAAEIGADAVIIGTAFLKAAQSGIEVFTDFLDGFNSYLQEDSWLTSSL